MGRRIFRCLCKEVRSCLWPLRWSSSGRTPISTSPCTVSERIPRTLFFSKMMAIRRLLRRACKIAFAFTGTKNPILKSAREIITPNAIGLSIGSGSTELLYGIVCGLRQSHKLRVDVAVRCDGVNRKTQLASQGKPTQCRGDVDSDLVLFKYAAIVPMPGEQMF